MKPICVPCQRFYRPKHNGEAFIEAMPVRQPAAPGTSHPENWAPYKLWSGDLWECQGCQGQIIVGVGQHPIAEHYQPEFELDCRRLKARIVVNDC